MTFKIFNREVSASRKELAKLGIILTLYILFLIWVKSWLGIIVIPFIIDNYTTRFIPWGWWKRSKNAALRTVMSWVDAIVFALVAVYFVHLYFFQNYVIPTSSLEKSLLVGDYLFVSKYNYGPRKPQTPLSMPLTQHTMPVVGGKSYIDAVQWDYERVAGLENIERGDIVVFNYPAGDVATSNPEIIDFHSLCYEFGKQLNPELTTEGATAEETRGIYEKYYADGKRYMAERPDVFGKITYRPVDRRENYVKRCVGLPGETLQIIDKVIYIDGQPIPQPKNVQFNYNVKLTQAIPENLRRSLGISGDDLRMLYQTAQAPLTEESYDKLKNNGRLVEEISIVNNDYTQGIYPLNGNTGWSVDNYGPVRIPKRGESIPLTIENLAVYERPIVAYEGNRLEVKDGKILINGKESDSYTFKMDYYWMMGDNRHNSADSRCWGFVPEDHIVGKPLFVWLSLDKDRNWFDGKVRWERLFRSVDSFK
ncbi:MAG: S26 family signal peptidase [Bacteroidaceae bacterium]|nr:S26 family signal peptidase [Bacteroidaceae bacterium]